MWEWIVSVSVPGFHQWSTPPSPCCVKEVTCVWWGCPNNPCMWRMSYRMSVSTGSVADHTTDCCNVEHCPSTTGSVSNYTTDCCNIERCPSATESVSNYFADCCNVEHCPSTTGSVSNYFADCCNVAHCPSTTGSISNYRLLQCRTLPQHYRVCF